MNILEKIKQNKTLTILIAIIIFGAVLRFAFISTPSIRGDEGPALFMRDLGFGNWWESTIGDAHPPLYYLLLKLVPSLGFVITPFRIFSAVLGIATIYLVFLLGKKLFNENVGLFASFIFAVSQANIKYAQIVRSYSLFTFLSVLSVLFFAYYLSDKKDIYLTGWVIVSALGCWTHYFFAFAVLAQLIYLVLFYRNDKKIVKSFAIGLLMLVIVTAPLLPILYYQTITAKTIAIPSYEYNDPLLKFTLTTPLANNLFVRIGMMFSHLSAGYHSASFGTGFLLFISTLGLAFGLPILFGAKNIAKNKKLMLMALLPATLIVCLSAIWAFGLFPYQTYARFILFVSPFYYLFVAAGAVSIPKINTKKLLIVLAIAILALNAISLHEYYTVQVKEDNMEYLSSLVEGAGPNDVILVHTGMYAMNLPYTYNGRARVFLAPDGIESVTGLSLKDYVASIKPVTEKNMCNFVDDIGSPDRVWLMQNSPNIHDEGKLLKKCLEQSYTLVKTYSNTYKNAIGDDETDFYLYEFSKQ